MHKRVSTLEITEEEQLQTLCSPIALDIVRVLRHVGPCSVSELGPRLGKKPNSLQYHVRKLQAVGLITTTETRRSGKRPERIYDVTADRFVGKDIHKNEGLSQVADEAAASLCRLAARDFARSPKPVSGTDEDRESQRRLAVRLTARLTDKDVEEAKNLLGKLESLFSNRVGSKDGEMFALTFIQTPLKED